jgi:hypothetical protein
MCKATIVVDVQMGQDDASYITGPDAEGAQLRPDLLITLDTKRHFPSNVGMERLAGLEQMRPLARIHHDHAFRVGDDPRTRREPSRPLPVREHSEPSSQSASAPLDLRALDPDGAGSDGMELHALTTIDRTISG